MPPLPSVIEGQVIKTLRCGKCVVTFYENAKKVHIKFLDTGYTNIVEASQLRSKRVYDPYAKIVCGVGYVGEGKYSASKTPFIYTKWYRMLDRCYNPNGQDYKYYKNVKVVDRWHCLQNFGADIETMPNYNKKGWELDKDLLIIDNKKYGPNTCSFVPHELNKIGLFNYSDGVRLDTRKLTKKYTVYLHEDGKQKFKGSFTTLKEAKLFYREVKIQRVRKLANRYKKLLHPKVLQNLLSYTGKS